MEKPYQWFKVNQFTIDTDKPKQLSFLENKEKLITLARLANLTIPNEANISQKLSPRDMLSYLYSCLNQNDSHSLFFFITFGKNLVVTGPTKLARYIPKKTYEEVTGFIDITIDIKTNDICVHHLFHLPWDGTENFVEIAHILLNTFPDDPIEHISTGNVLKIKTRSIYVSETDLTSQMLLSELGYTAISVKDKAVILFTRPVDSPTPEKYELRFSNLN